MMSPEAGHTISIFDLCVPAPAPGPGRGPSYNTLGGKKWVLWLCTNPDTQPHAHHHGDLFSKSSTVYLLTANKNKNNIRVKQLRPLCIIDCNKSFISRKTSEWSCMAANKSPAMFLETEMRNICREPSEPAEMDKAGTPSVWIRVVLILGQSPSPGWQLQPQVLLYNATLSYWNRSTKQSLSWHIGEIYNWYEKASFLVTS